MTEGGGVEEGRTYSGMADVREKGGSEGVSPERGVDDGDGERREDVRVSARGDQFDVFGVEFDQDDRV